MGDLGRLSFGGVVDRYDKARPGYPPEAVAWLVGEQQSRVVELGAGTGKLTESVVAAGHRVLATDADERMLVQLRRRVPGSFAVTGTAEQIPVETRSVDVVLAAQAFHWFDHPVALPEIARVLRIGGHLSLVWNVRDEGVPWVRKLSKVIGSEQNWTFADELRESDHFLEVETAEFRHWHSLRRNDLVDLAASRSYVATLPEVERAELLDQVGALYDEYGRGPDGMLLPYRTYCFRAQVADLPPPPEPEQPATTDEGEPTQPINRADLPKSKPADPDDGTLLIDFR